MDYGIHLSISCMRVKFYTYMQPTVVATKFIKPVHLNYVSVKPFKYPTLGNYQD